MGNEVVLGIRLTADNGVAVGAVKATREELDKLDQAQQRSTTSAGKAASQYSGLSQMFKGSQSGIAANTQEYQKLDAQLVALRTRIDPLFASTRQLDSANDLLHRGLKEGLLTQSQYDDALGKLSTDFGAAAAGADKSAFSTAGARRELIVLGHEAVSGNFSRMPGSVMVLAERMGGAAMTSAVLGLALRAGPVAAALLLVAAFEQGQKEAEQMDRALQLTSNYAGQTRGSMLGLAQDVSAAGTVTIGTAKDLVTQLVNSGRIGADSIGAIARLASDYARSTGSDISKLGPELVKLFDDPSKGAAELNKQMHFLTTADQEYIDHLVRIGQEEQARVVLAQKLNEHLPKQVENLGLLEKAWDGIKNASSSAWDAMLNIGREDTLDQQIKKLQAELLQAAEGGNAIRTQFLAGQLAQLQNQKTTLDANAKAEGDAKEAAEQRAKAYDEIKKSQTYQITALKDELTLVKSFKPADSSEAADQARRVLEITRQIRDLQSNLGRDPKQEAINSAQVAYNSALADAAKSADKFMHDNQIQVLDNQLKLSLVSYADYFDQKRAIEDDYYTKEIGRVQDKIAIEQKAADQARARGDKAGALGKDTSVVKLQSDLAGLQQQQQNSTQKIAQDASAANDQLARQLLGAEAQMLNVSEQYGAAAVANAALQYSDLIKRLQAEGNTGGVDLIQRLINVQAVKGQIQEIETSYSRMLTDLDAEAKRIDIEKNTGILTEYEARQKLLTLYRQQLELTNQELVAQQALREQETTPEEQQASDVIIQQLHLKIAQLADTVSEANRTFEYGAKSAVDDYFDTITNRATQARDVLSTTFKSAEDTLAEFFMTGKLNATSFFNAIENSIAHLAAQRLLTPLVGSSDNPGLLSNLLSSLFSGLFKNASGNAFTSAGVVPFANGGAFGDGQVLTRPTYFKFGTGGQWGVAGEAGPEAALPLKRMSGGKLGVYVEGGSGNGGGAVVNINYAPGTSLPPPRVQQSTGADGRALINVFIDEVRKDLMRDVQGGGQFSQVIEGQYALNRAAGAGR